MTDTSQNLAMCYVPTLAQRFWLKLGYRYHIGEDPQGADILPGWHCTEISMNFGFLDRLRLLVTGKLKLRSILMTDTPSAAVCKNRLDWRIICPGGEMTKAGSHVCNSHCHICQVGPSYLSGPAMDSGDRNCCYGPVTGG